MTYAKLALGAALLSLQPAPASAEERAFGMLLYHVSGVVNSGDADNQFGATHFYCTNIGSAAANMRIFLRDDAGATQAILSYSIARNATVTAATKRTMGYQSDVLPGKSLELEQGSAMIRSTSRMVVCSAAQIDATALNPAGIALHMVRFNPIAGSIE